ncbi:glutamate ligase domain-containing protein [Streptomyces jumonjinensis]|uniref:glutamate ligase domain-containing protein n=1 Tax=Streptomyces jumonjinensis TaxID=1945 RepID=UPI00378CC16A
MAERGHIRAPESDRLRARLAATRWPGRLELVPEARLGDWTGRVLLDGATNPQGVTTVAPEILRHARADGRPGRPPVLVFSATKDRDFPAMLAPLPSHWPLILTRTDFHQAAAPTALRSSLASVSRGPCLIAEDTPSALRRAAGLAGPGGLIVVIGSHRLVGETRTELTLPPV